MDNMKNEIKTVAIIGLGALGILYGQHFLRNLPKENLRIVADQDRIDRYKKEKIFCNGVECDFSYITPSENCNPADLVIVTVKYGGLSKAIDYIRNQVGENTLIISALNGISSEEMLAGAFGTDRIIYSVAQGMDATRIGNELTYSHMGKLFFGDMAPGVFSDKVKIVSEFFDKTGFPYEIEVQMKHRLWGKFMMNVGVNQAAAVYECSYRGLQKPGLFRDTVIGAMKEVLLLADCEGIDLTEKDIDYWLEVLDKLNPDGMPSMQQDILAKRRSEVDLFSGTVISLGNKHNIATPVNRMLYDKIAEKERKFV